MLSIAKLGIQVPIAVYWDDDDDIYRLIDGERRWRCSKKLNLQSMPALVQEKPTTLDNLLMMYNIHALREQWDYFTIASKLERIIELYEEENGRLPTETALSEATGLARGQIRRCQLLLDLPVRFKDQLMAELELPRSQQKLSEDLFIEMERAVKTVVNRIPEFRDDIEHIRDTLVEKYKSGKISAVTDFRQLAKIATSIKNLGISKGKATNSLKDIFNKENDIGIREVFRDTVEFEYDEHKAAMQVTYLTEYVEEVMNENQTSLLDEEFLDDLRELHSQLSKLLGG